MTAETERMQVTIIDRGLRLGERLRDRLDQAASLLCLEHGQHVVAVTIHGQENGWFDSRWTTCCEGLEQRAAKIVKERC
jgi:hypothetical protein